MSKSIFSAPHFNDEQAAYDYVEARIWANGRACPHCGAVDQSTLMQGKTTRPGLYCQFASNRDPRFASNRGSDSISVQLRLPLIRHRVALHGEDRVLRGRTSGV